MIIMMSVIFITTLGVGTFENSSYEKRASEGSSGIIRSLHPTRRCCPGPAPPRGPRASTWSRSIISLVLRLTAEGVAVHLPPRSELFVRPRDGTGGGPNTWAQSHGRLNHAKT